MNIQGLQKLTLLDFPGVCACTIFTAGCNLLCPFCHNSSLVVNIDKTPQYTNEDILAFLEKRRGILEGIAITGGEPLLQPDIIEFIKSVKDAGFKVKLDTNGTLPKRLRPIVEEELVDYIAMDVKAAPEVYPQCVGNGRFDISGVKESISLLMNGNVDYEFRTTVVNEFHTAENIKGVGELIKGAKRHFLQGFKDSGELIGFDLSPVPKDEMKKMQQVMLQYVDSCELRGV